MKDYSQFEYDNINNNVNISNYNFFNPLVYPINNDYYNEEEFEKKIYYRNLLSEEEKNNIVIINNYLIFSKVVNDYISDYSKKHYFEILGNKNAEKKLRKYENDDIYKKIRGNFFHIIVKNKLNQNLKLLGIKVKFVFTDISQNTKIEDNIINLNSTLEEVLKSVKSNEKVFEELEKIGGGDEELKTILSTKMEYLYKEYFNSQEFQNSIKKLIEDSEPCDYINIYIKKSKEFFDYYSIEKAKNK